MTEPPLPPYGQDPNRPQDTPRSFPSYGRPERQESPYDRSRSPFTEPPASFVPPYQPPPQGPPQGPPYPGAYGPPPPPYGYGYGYPGALQNKTNGLAIAALITGVSSIFFGIVAPVAIGLGIAALVQIKRRQESGTGQAVAGVALGSVISLAWAAVLVVLIAVGWNSADGDYAGGAPAPTSSYSMPTTYVEDLAVGECFDDGEEEAEVVRMPCSELHDGELISNVTLPAGPYPGDVKVRNAAEASCDQEFSKYIGITVDKSELEPGFWYPLEEYWDEDRLVVCAAYGPSNEQLTGSVKGTKR